MVVSLVRHTIESFRHRGSQDMSFIEGVTWGARSVRIHFARPTYIVELSLHLPEKVVQLQHLALRPGDPLWFWLPEA